MNPTEKNPIDYDEEDDELEIEPSKKVDWLLILRHDKLNIINVFCFHNSFLDFIH